MDEPVADSRESETKDGPYYSTLGRSTSRRSTPGRFTPGRSSSGKSPSGRSISARSSTPGLSISGRSTSGKSTPDRSTTPEPPPVPPATYNWEEVRRKRSVGGYPWTHLNKPPFDEKTFVKHERDHVYELVTPAASTDRISSAAKQNAAVTKDDGRHFLRIPLTEELVMADETGSEAEDDERRKSEEERDSDDDEDDGEGEDEDADDDYDDDNVDKKPQSDGSIYEGENENSSAGEVEVNGGGGTRMKVFQQKVKVKADILRAKLQGVTKRKPKQKKIVVDAATNGEKSRRKFGQFATLPKKFTFSAPKVNFSSAFGNFSRNAAADVDEPGVDEAKGGGRFSLPRFGFSKTSSESPKPSKSAKIGASRLSIPGFRARTWSDASKASKPDGAGKPKLMDFGTYPRIFSKRRKTDASDKADTPPPPVTRSNGDDAEPNKRKDSFRRRFFRTHKESTPAPTEEQTATLAVEEELDESHVSKESLAEFGDSDLQEVISLSDDCRSKDTKSLSEHRPGVIEEIDSDEFFLREKGLSRGDVHISNYLSSEIRDVFRSNRTRSVEGVNNNNNSIGIINNADNNVDNDDGGTATPVRPSRTNSLRRPACRQNATDTNNAVDRFSTMPKSFGGTKPWKRPDNDMPENIITSQTFEPAQSSVLPSTFRVPWRTTQKENAVVHMPPKPPTRQRMSKFSTFDTRSMIDLSRKRSQSQIGFLPSMNFSETVPKAPLRRSRTSLAGSERDVSTASEIRPSWTAASTGAPTPPLRRSRMSLTTDADVEERSANGVTNGSGEASSCQTISGATTTRPRATPPRPPPPTSAVAVGYATVDKSLLLTPQSPARHRRKKSYEVIKSQEFGAFFTVPRSYSYNRKPDAGPTATATEKLPPPPPSRPARAYNTLGPSRPRRNRLPVREHEYGDVTDDDDGGVTKTVNGPTAATSASTEREGGDGGDEYHGKRQTLTAIAARSSSLDDTDGPAKPLFSGDVVEKMKLRPLPSPPPPPRKSRAPNDTPEPHRRRNTDSTLVPFLDRRETSATSSDDFFADVSRALLASAAKKTAAAATDDVSIGVQTDPLPDGYELDDLESCCSAESDRPVSRASVAAATATDRPTSRTSTNAEHAGRSPSRYYTKSVVENGYAVMPSAATGVMCAQRISVNELQVGKMIVADIRGQRMGVDHVSGSSLNVTRVATDAMMPTLDTAIAAVLPSSCDPLQHHQHHHYHNHHNHQLPQDDAESVQSSRVSSMYPEVDSDEDRASVLAVPTPPRRRSKPTGGSRSGGHRYSTSVKRHDGDGNYEPPVDTAAAVDLSITELSCQLFRLCHSNVCNLFTKVVQQVVPEDTEKRRDLQAALCFLSIILAGLLILGFGNEKTVHHHHWDFQFPPANQ